MVAMAEQGSRAIRRLAIIPARGGSKRLPRKNILPLGGRPMLCWSVEAALASRLFERVCVSTDDDEIAAVAALAGAEVLRRPATLGSDQATVAEVCRHHLLEFDYQGEHYDHLYCLYPTAPLRHADDLRAMATIFESSEDAAAVVAVTSFMHYPHQALRLDDSGRLVPFWPELVDLRSSELPTLVAGNGSTYAVSVSGFVETLNFMPRAGLYAYSMDLMRSIDVDTQAEYDLLQAVVERCQRMRISP
jgi:CMP-N-acetylneuraminic acid synthetase